jgi:hypothetical protein
VEHDAPRKDHRADATGRPAGGSGG